MKWIKNTHGALDIKFLDLLPVLGKQVDEKVDRLKREVYKKPINMNANHGDVGEDGFLVLAYIGDTKTQTVGLLALELKLNGSLSTFNQ